MMQPFLENPLILPALLAGLASAVISGTVGTFVVVKRISFISGSISHAVLAGIGLSIWLERSFHLWEIPPLVGALVAAVAAAFCISHAERSLKEREDAIIATVWALGMALGIILISKTPGYTAELSSALLGNILWTSQTDICVLFGLACLCLLFVAVHFQQLKLVLFDPIEARLQGIPLARLYRNLLVLIAVTVVALAQVVGIVLVMTMLTLPQLLAGLFSSRLSTMIAFSIVASVLCTVTGLAVAFVCDWPAGASIALTSVGGYALGFCWKALYARVRRT